MTLEWKNLYSVRMVGSEVRWSSGSKGRKFILRKKEIAEIHFQQKSNANGVKE
jgi:hypothetical protein